ncbi:MAG: RNA methyltransferase [Nitrospirae bacterium]|nr:RNA methyltransferase [Nitrospirota bacterium]
MAESKLKHLKIVSPANERIKDAVSVRKRHNVSENGLVFVEGVRVLWSAIEARVSFGTVFYTEEFTRKNDSSKLIEAITRLGGEAVEVSDAVMDKLSGTEAPQGICALARASTVELDTLTGDRFVVCDGVKDTGNMGTIVRSADAFGASAVICLPGTCDPFGPKVVRASAGSVFHLPIARANREELVEWLGERRVPILIATPHGGKPVYETPLAGAFALVLGGEAGGVGSFMAEKAQLAVNVPMEPGVESLNVAITASICLYEAKRQRLNRHD